MTDPVVTPPSTPPAAPVVPSKEAPVVPATDGGAPPVATPVVPEKYADFKLPEGTTLEATQLTELQTAAKDLGLSQEAAQKYVDRTLADRKATETSVIAKAQESVKQQALGWKTQTEADKEIGGAAFKDNLATAVKARDQFATPELTKMLNDSGLGNHPEVVRFFYKVGKAMSEDKFVTAGNASAGTAANPDAARAARMYPSMAQK